MTSEDLFNWSSYCLFVIISRTGLLESDDSWDNLSSMITDSLTTGKTIHLITKKLSFTIIYQKL